MVDDKLFLRFRIDDRINCGTIRRLIEHIVLHTDPTAFRRIVNAPYKDMMAHGLRPNLRPAGRRLVLQSKSLARPNAPIAFEPDVTSDAISALIGGHPIILKSIIKEIDPLWNFRIVAPLMGYTGIVNIVKNIALDHTVVAPVPALHSIAKPYFKLPAPDAPPDKTKFTVSYHHMLRLRLSIAVDTAVAERQILRDHGP